MDSKKLAEQFEKSLIKHGLSEKMAPSDGLFSSALKVIGNGYVNKACQHMERLSDALESPIEDLMLYSLIIAAQDEVENIGFVVNGCSFGDSDTGLDFVVIEPQAKIENYRADFLLTFKSSEPGFEKGRQLVVECDGHDFHDKTKQQASRDKERDREMKKLGYDVFRFTGSDIWNDAFSCAKEAIDMVTGITEMKRIRRDKPRQSKNILSKKYKSMESMLGSAVDRMTNIIDKGSPISGISTGFKDIDSIISGLNDGDLIVVSSRPGVGKTSFALNVADHVAQQSDKSVLVFSLGMTEQQVLNRIIASNSLVELSAINNCKMNDRDWDLVSHSISQLIKSNMLIDADTGLSADDIFYRAKEASKDHGIGLVVIDYLQLIRTEQLMLDRRSTSGITSVLKQLARELNIPVLVTSQLNKSLEKRIDKRPTNADLPDFGAIEEDADVILHIYRDDIYHCDSPDKGTAEIIIGKQRNGETGVIRMAFNCECSRFSDFAGNAILEDY